MYSLVIIAILAMVALVAVYATHLSRVSERRDAVRDPEPRDDRRGSTT